MSRVRGGGIHPSLIVGFQLQEQINMYISHKSNVLQQVHETEWQCRRLVKGQSKSEYWAWLDSVTSVTGTAPDEVSTVDLSGETGYTIVECTDEDVQARLAQLGDYVSILPEGTTYNIKYYVAKEMQKKF